MRPSDIPEGLPVIDPFGANASQAALSPRKPTAAQCITRFGREIAAGGTWAVLLAALAAIAATAAIAPIAMQGSYTTQQQYAEAKTVARQLQAGGMGPVSIGSYEDGLSPDGCCVVGWMGSDSVKLSIERDGEIAAVSYRVSIDDIDDIDPAAVNSNLQSLSNSVGKTSAEAGFEIGEAPFNARQMKRGLERQSVMSKRVKARGVELERIYRYENHKDHGVLDVTVKEPPADVDGSADREAKEGKRGKTALWTGSDAPQGNVDRRLRYL